MKYCLVGNQSNKNEDDTRIYNLTKYIPQTKKLDNFPLIKEQDTYSFIENMYFITMEENGNAYFYPNESNKENICRFEWHYEYRGSKYGLRVGLIFKVKSNKLNDVSFYIIPHDNLIDIQDLYYESEIEVNTYNEIIDSIHKKICESTERANNIPIKRYNSLYYISLENHIDKQYRLNDDVIIMPSRIVDGKIISAVVVISEGYSYFSSKHKSDEKVNLACAILSLFTQHVSIENGNDLPKCVEPIPIDKNIDFDKLNDVDLGFLYPGAKKIISEEYKLSNDILCYVGKVFNYLSKGEPERKILNILFSFYSATKTESVNKTVSLVSYIACLDSIANIKLPDFMKEHGHRKTIVELIRTMFNLSGDSLTKLNKWSKNIYNEHRSSYVHGASISFEEFSQSMDRKNKAGLPKSMPAKDRLVTKQHGYEIDFLFLKDVARKTLLVYVDNLADIKDSPYDYTLNMDQLKPFMEAHFGIPNNGVITIDGHFSFKSKQS